jgi:two-component system sensor histidine kinase/response regulator
LAENDKNIVGKIIELIFRRQSLTILAFTSCNKLDMRNKILANALFIVVACLNAHAGERSKTDSLQRALNEATTADSLDILLQIGNAFFQKEQYSEALEAFFASYQISECVDSVRSSAEAANNIGRVYYHMEKYADALKYFNLALTCYENQQDEKRKGGVYNNIALIYYELDSLNVAASYYDTALTIYEKYDQKLQLATIYHNLGLLYLNTQKTAEAIANLQSSKQIFTEEGYLKYAANATNNIGRAYYKNKQFEEAIPFLEEGLEEAKQANSAFLIMDNYQYQADCFTKMGLYKQALEMTTKHYELKDSLLTKENEEAMAEIQARYESEIHARENVLLRKENESKAARIRLQNILGLGSMLIMILIGLALISYYRGNRAKSQANAMLMLQKKKIEEKNAQLSEINEQMSVQHSEIITQKQELEELNTIKDKLFSIISHEFRSPLNSLKGTLKLLNMGVLSDDEQQRISEVLSEKIDSTSMFLDNLLHWAKSQMQGINPKPVEVDLGGIARESVSLLRPLADQKKLVIQNDIPTGSDVWIDYNMAELVFRNLLSNAIKFSMAGGTISLASHTSDNFIKISVKDTGVGIPDEKLKILFTEQTLSTRGTSKETGIGIGLLITKSFIESNGGKIWVDSKENKGSTFSFTVPRYSPMQKG